MPDIELLRDVFALVHSGETFSMAGHGGRSPQRVFCDCERSKRYAACAHAEALVREAAALRRLCGDVTPSSSFASNLVFRLLEPAVELRVPVCNAQATAVSKDTWIVTAGNGTRIAISGSAPSALRLLGRLEIGQESRRGRLLRRCRQFAQTDTERALHERGICSTREAEEDSLWYRLAYHCWRESLTKPLDISASIDERDGELTVNFVCGGSRVQAVIPRAATYAVIRRLAELAPACCAFRVAPDVREAIFRCVFSHDGSAVHLEALVETPETAAGRAPLRPELMHGRMVYIPEAALVVELTQGGIGALALHLHDQPPLSPVAMARLLEDNVRALSIDRADCGAAQLSLFGAAGAATLDRVVDPPLLRSFDRLALEPLELGERQCRVRVWYEMAGRRVPFATLQAARGENRRFALCTEAIVDLCAERMASLPLGGAPHADGAVTLSRAELLQFAGEEIAIEEGGCGRELAALLSIKPAGALLPLAGLRSSLRPYQMRGVEWLLFLYDNHFGGLLCDEMGLGKTHQALGLICAVAEQRFSAVSALVVCPATVIGHWQELLRRFAPEIDCIVYHGPERRLGGVALKPRVVLTSYGVLRNDADRLAATPFSLAVFDEASNLKNRSTGAWEAACRIPARMKLCMTGTPVENSLADLKSLFDLAMPGYLGTDTHFIDAFLSPIENANDWQVQARLRRLTSPFILRRLKRDVLAELPEKIIDVRTCALSDEQREMYNSLARREKAALAGMLRDPAAPAPILHIFRLLSSLKQICNHPAAYLKRPECYTQHSSGKFDLFAELLEEALASGEKIVVFSHYLDMIDIIARHVKALNTGFVTLTGSTVRRSEIVKRFNGDDSIRVFVGSIRAGGLGIDLTAASVVIHYDRWWNAAREEQATDRVHRMGQTRGVQIFKFITLGTVEQRIDDIIARKATLAGRALAADSPESLKVFTREELLKIVEEA